MTPEQTDRSPRRFHRFELQPGERRRLTDGEPVAIGARAFDMLAMLAGRVDVVDALIGEVPPPATARRWAELHALLAVNLPPGELAQLVAEGALMTDEAAFACAFGDGEAASGPPLPAVVSAVSVR